MALTALVALTARCGGAASSEPGDSDAALDVAADTDTTDGADIAAPHHGTIGPSDADHISLGGDAGALLVLHGNDASQRVVIPTDGFALGVVPALDPTRAYDPWFLEPEVVLHELYTPLDLTWHTARAVGPVTLDASGDHATAPLDFGALGLGALEITRAAAGRFDLRWHAPAAMAGVPVFFRLHARVDPGDRFYGLGELFDHVEHRGRRRPMQLEAARLESHYNEAHAPIPLLIGTRGWGLYVASVRPGVFDLAATAPDEVRVTYGLGADHAAGLAFHLFVAAHPLDITRYYHDVTGLPGVVAPWALGPWLWRNEVDDQAAVEQDLTAIRDLDLATTGYWIDRPYASAVNSFDFAPATYPNPAAMMARARDLGFAVALWHTPYLDPAAPASAPAYAAAAAAGWFPPEMGTALGPWGPPLDFTHPDAVAWWQQQLARYTDLGVVGYKLDYGEEIIVSAADARLPWRFHDGRDELTMHRAYQLGYHAAYRATLPETGGFLLCRAAAPGDQAHGLIIWPGDIDANMARHGDTVTSPDDDATYLAVGGLPAAVVAGSSLGASGFPLFAADTGGYRHSPPDRETYIRWIEQSALTPVMQSGTRTNDLPWSLGPTHADDPELLALYRRYARLHLRLWPYLWAHVRATRAPLTPDGPRGRAIQRPLGLAHPELGVHPDDIYLLGDDLLVAPVVTPGVTARDVPLPAATWVDWWTGARHDGPATVTLAAPLDTLPLLVRAGAPVPLLRPDIDTLLPTPGDPTLVTPATPGPALWVRVTAGPAGRFTLADGAALSQAPDGPGRLRLAYAPALGAAPGDVVVFELFGVGPDAAPVDAGLTRIALPDAFTGSPGTWAHDPARAGGTLWVAVSGAADLAIATAP